MKNGNYEYDILKELQPQPMYGVPDRPLEKYINITQKVIIPIILIIGIIVYWKKSKRTTKQKVIILTLFSILLVVMWFAGITIYEKF